MMEVESALEKKKRELVLRSDFNLNDAFKLFNSVKNNRKGIDCDDLYYVLTHLIGLNITKDEVFILFYKLDRDSDSFINYTELSKAFVPKSQEYAVLI
jgi:Ca2+-binding EF-hand superfamily protein